MIYSFFYNLVLSKGYLLSELVNYERKEKILLPNILLEFDDKFELARSLGRYSKKLGELFEQTALDKSGYEFLIPSREFHEPFRIRKIIVNVNASSAIIQKWFAKGQILKIPQFEFHITNQTSISEFRSILSLSELDLVLQIVLVLDYKLFDLEELNRLLVAFPHITRVIFFDAPETMEYLCSGCVVIYKSDNYTELTRKTPQFDYSFTNYQKSKGHNLFFKGIVFGNDNLTISLFQNSQIQYHIFTKDDILSSGFLDDSEFLWNTSKEVIGVCCDCERRTFCRDKRVPILNNKHIYFKTECNYNPYIAKWKGEEGYRTLAECGVKSDETGFSIDHARIAKINEELWGSPT